MKTSSKWRHWTAAASVVTGLYEIQTPEFRSTSLYCAQRGESGAWSFTYTPEPGGHHQPFEPPELYESEEHTRAAFVAFAHYSHHARRCLFDFPYRAERLSTRQPQQGHDACC